MLKRLSVFLFFVLCSLCAYGQNPDLIVTVTGDSIRCRIIDAGVNEMQFRFGSGQVISIKRSQVASFEYNYKSEKSRNQGKPGKSEKPVKAPADKGVRPVRMTPDHARFYAALSAGTGSFGSVSFGKTEGSAFLLGADAAYFFKTWIGAGLKLNTISGKVDFGERLTYHDRVMFYGPALHGCFGKNSVNVNVCAAIGGINWKLSNQMRKGVSEDDKSLTTLGGFLSAGVSYRFTKNMGVGFNVQSMLGTAKDDVIHRNPAGIGCTLGLNFRF